MREPADLNRIQALMRALAAEADVETRLYFTGGATAVLLGWRASTIDVDLRFIPESGRLFTAIAGLKETLRINVELAWPPDFIPQLPGWESRSLFIAGEGNLTFYHYDPYSQALAKIERRHEQDREDVRQMIQRGLVEPVRALELLDAVWPDLNRYPAIDPRSFRRAAEEILTGARQNPERS